MRLLIWIIDHHTAAEFECKECNFPRVSVLTAKLAQTAKISRAWHARTKSHWIRFGFISNVNCIAESKMAHNTQTIAHTLVHDHVSYVNVILLVICLIFYHLVGRRFYGKLIHILSNFHTHTTAALRISRRVPKNNIKMINAEWKQITALFWGGSQVSLYD